MSGLLDRRGKRAVDHSGPGCAEHCRARPELARGPVLLALVTLAAALTAVSAGYGYHRDELYFRMLPTGWGYVDEPPFTPLVARATQLLADQPWALRIPATLATLASVWVLVLVTRELGGGRRAQALCAWGYGFASLTLIMGHVLLTSTIDLVVWPTVVLFVIRAQVRTDPRWWLAAGAAVGLSTYNKLLVVVLLVALAGGILITGPRRLLISRWVWAAVGVAVVIGLPNLVYQAGHGWPQLSMGRALAADNASSVRVMMWPFLFLILGPPLVPIWIAGLSSLLRRPEWRPIRFLAAAFPVLLLLVFVMGSQFYYPFGLLAVLYAVGCVPTERWMRGWRTGLTGAAVGLNAAVSVALGLPAIALSVLGDTPVPAINQVARDTVGWPAYVREISAVYARLPATERAETVVLASNYGEAGAVARYGRSYGLPAVYSGHNQLYYLRRPPDSASTVVFVGGQVDTDRQLFGSCRITARLDDGVGVDNEEQGEPIAVCRDPVGGWATAWPALRHED